MEWLFGLLFLVTILAKATTTSFLTFFEETLDGLNLFFFEKNFFQGFRNLQFQKTNQDIKKKNLRLR